jgi:hypothetical protein
VSFQAIEEPLDAVAQPVDGLVDGVLYFPVRLGRDIRNFLAPSIAVVAFVAKQLLEITIHLLHQRRECGHIVGLSRRDDEPDRHASRVGARVSLVEYPRERPTALRSALPFRRQHIDAPG